MSAVSRSAPRLHRPAPKFLKALLKRFKKLPRKEQRRPFYPREIEDLRAELERKKASADLHARFKVM